jgi:AraC-like DNA-binding protein
VGSTLSSLAIQSVVAAVQYAGADAEVLLNELGIAPESLQNSEGRIPTDVAFRAFERAVEFVGDEGLFLRFAEAIPLGAFEVLDFAGRSSLNMGEGLSRLIRYFALIDSGSTLRVERDGRVARLIGDRTDPPSPRPATELLFGVIVVRGRQFTGRSWPMREACFHRPAPRSVATHERFFGAPVRFNRPRNELVFDAAWLDVPCLTRDPPLASFLDRQLNEQLSRVPRPTSFLEEVKRAVAEAIQGSEPLIDGSARRLHMGARTLQRRLQGAETSHRAIVEEVRRERAHKLLRETQMSINEIAYLLGFANASAFHRAFTRWTGVNPSSYRKDPHARG